MVDSSQRLWRDERGATMVFIAVGMMGFMAASMLAIDVGMLMTARNQAQNAADAGALGGAVALAFDNYDDRSASGPAVQSAVQTATANNVMGSSISVSPSDVQFVTGTNGQQNRVRVTVYRSAARGNALSTGIAAFFGRPTADVTATATAEAAPANAETCVAPFTIPDKWIERQTPPWDQNDTFSAFPANPSLQPDVYYGVNQANYTGYDAVRDKGLQLTLKAGTGSNIAPSFYFGLALPGSTGAADYRLNISSCNTSVMHFGDLLTAEPGNMVGPTKQGIDDLVAQDPSAYWDTTTNEVVSSMHPSPRIKVVPIFDPYYWAVGKQSGRTADLKAANYIGFFIEGMQGNNVIGRITPVRGILDNSGGAAPSGAFPRAIRLVE